MRTKKQIEEKFELLATQGTDMENPIYKEIQAQANILAWVLEREKEFE